MKERKTSYYVYLLRCGDGTLYTGYTDDVERRLAVHQSGKGAKYTRSRLPVELVYSEALPDKSAALRREAAIKRLPREKKLALIERGKERVNTMRRKDREMTAEFAWSVVEKSDYAVVAMADADGAPYCVPVNLTRDGESVLFHSAMVGRKNDILRAHPQVCVNCVCGAEVLQDGYTTLYESATLFGTVEEITDPAEKTQALRKICLRYAPNRMDRFEGAIARSLTATAVWRISVTEITGKKNG